MSSLIVRLLIFVIRGYQRLISPSLRPCCRFAPSCSEYAVESLHCHGLFKGSAKTIWRLLRCNPWGGSGYDPP